MIFINLAFVLLFIMLAILSRKNFSKYKKKEGVGRIFFFWLGMGDMLYRNIFLRINEGRIEKRLRKYRVSSEENIHKMAEEYFVVCISAGLAIAFVFNLLSVYASLTDREVEGQNIIEREDYQGYAKALDVYLDAEGESRVYSLEIQPVEYTEAEFLQESEKLFTSLETEILGDNTDAEHIIYDLELPTKDEQGIFQISWSSDEPSYITSYGQVCSDELVTDTPVVMTATVSYMDYSVSRDYPLVLRTFVGNVEASILDNAGQKLDELEKESRNDRTLTLPEEIDGVLVSLNKTDRNKPGLILAFGVLLSCIPLCFMLAKLRDEGKKRDDMLTLCYTSFVNRLWLLLATGMTIKGCMKKLTENNHGEALLTEELMYTIREIDTGVDEAFAYEQLGIRLSLQQYSRLMSHISQNLRLGTKDLTVILEDEVHLAMETRKERAAKLGEQASTKLLLPMILMLVTVMVIIIMPAVLEF